MQASPGRWGKLLSLLQLGPEADESAGAAVRARQLQHRCRLMRPGPASAGAWQSCRTHPLDVQPPAFPCVGAGNCSGDGKGGCSSSVFAELLKSRQTNLMGTSAANMPGTQRPSTHPLLGAQLWLRAASWIGLRQGHRKLEVKRLALELKAAERLHCRCC